MNEAFITRRTQIDRNQNSSRLCSSEELGNYVDTHLPASKWSYDKSLLDLTLMHAEAIRIEEPLERLEEDGLPFKGALWLEGQVPFFKPQFAHRIGILVSSLNGVSGGFRFSMFYEVENLSVPKAKFLPPTFLKDPTNAHVTPREGFRISHPPSSDDQIPFESSEEHAWRVGIFLSRLFILMNKFSELRTPSNQKINKTKNSMVSGVAPLRLKPESIKALKAATKAGDFRRLLGFTSINEKAKRSLAEVVAHDYERPYSGSGDVNCVQPFIAAFSKVPHIAYDNAILSMVQGSQKTTTGTERLNLLKKTGTFFHKMWIEGPYDFPGSKEEGLRIGALVEETQDGFAFSFIKEFELPKEVLDELQPKDALIPILPRSTANFVVNKQIRVSAAHGIDTTEADAVIGSALEPSQIENLADHLTCLLILMGSRRDLLSKPEPRDSPDSHRKSIEIQIRQTSLDITRSGSTSGSGTGQAPEWERWKAQVRKNAGNAVDTGNWAELFKTLEPIAKQTFGPDFTVDISRVRKSIPIPYKSKKGFYTRREHFRIDVRLEREEASRKFLEAAYSLTAHKPARLAVDNRGLPQIILTVGENDATRLKRRNTGYRFDEPSI